MVRKKTAERRWLAEQLATYPGLSLPWNDIDYETHVGLWLNRHRARALAAAATRRAVASALSGHPDPLLVDAELSRAGDTSAALADQELARMKAETLSKFGGG